MPSLRKSEDALQFRLMRDYPSRVPLSIILAIVVAVAVMMASPILLAIIFLLIPTRKGKMRTERSLTELRSSSQKLKTRFEATLGKDGFQLVEPADAVSIYAVRPREPVTEVYAKNRPALHMSITFEPQGSAVSARVTAEYDDFILLDSGEGWELRNALDRLLSNNPPIGPVTRRRSIGSTLLSAVIIPILSGLIMLWFWERSDSGNLNHAGVWGGLVFACVGGLFVARDGGSVIRVRPITLKGLPFVAIAFVLNGACAVAGTVAFWTRFGEAIKAAVRAQFQT